MPILQQTSGVVSPLASSRAASLSIRSTWSAVHRFFRAPSWAQSSEDSHFRWTSSWGADHLDPRLPRRGVRAPEAPARRSSWLDVMLEAEDQRAAEEAGDRDEHRRDK